jgi:hypothetical protein
MALWCWCWRQRILAACCFSCCGFQVGLFLQVQHTTKGLLSQPQPLLLLLLLLQFMSP